MNKKAWKTPELIILARNRPEEAVLAICKDVGVTASIPTNNSQGCGDNTPGNCGTCQNRSGQGS
jgi:hypothetical protein